MPRYDAVKAANAPAENQIVVSPAVIASITRVATITISHKSGSEIGKFKFITPFFIKSIS